MIDETKLPSSYGFINKWFDYQQPEIRRNMLTIKPLKTKTANSSSEFTQLIT